MRLLSLSPVTALVAAVDVEAQDTLSPILELPPIPFGEQAITQVAYERLQSPAGNAVGLSTVKFSNNCLCESEHFLNFQAQYADFSDNADDEGIVDSVLPSSQNT